MSIHKRIRIGRYDVDTAPGHLQSAQQQRGPAAEPELRDEPRATAADTAGTAPADLEPGEVLVSVESVHAPFAPRTRDAAARPATVASPARASRAAASTLDYEFFKTRVQPIFLAKRPGHARCITCHESGQPRLAVLSDGATTWNEEQSRQNFAAWQRVVVPGNPNASRLLMHPLAKSAGGDPFHAGGKHFQSRDDPEFQTLVAWVQTGSRAPQSTAASGLDFEYYRARIEPIFLKERAPNEGAGMCVNCHARIATRMRLQPLPPGSSGWTMEQSRQNFEAVSRVVMPGDVLKSPLAIHPLAQAAGGDAQHTGGKFWASQDNPEWQTVSTWIKSADSACVGECECRTIARFRIFQDAHSTDLPGEASGTCPLHHLSRERPAAVDCPARRRLRLDRRAVAPELRGLAAGRRAGRPVGQPPRHAPAGQERRRRSVPCRRQALAIAERPRIPSSCSLDPRRESRSFIEELAMTQCSSFIRVMLVAGVGTLLIAAPGAQSRVARIIQTNAAGDNAHVIDPVTNKVVGVIEGIEVPHGVSAAPDGRKLFITNESLAHGRCDRPARRGRWRSASR